jgi:hypothetical protein
MKSYFEDRDGDWVIRRSTAWCAGRARDLIMRLHEEFGLSVSDDTIYGALKELGFSDVSARPKAYKQDAKAMEGVQKNFAERVAEVRAKLVSGTPVEVWIQDEIGLVRRTNSPIAWPERAHVRAPATINAPSRPICSARYARKTRSRCRPRAACSFISTRSPPRSPPAATPFSFSIKSADMAQKDLHVPSSISLLPLSPRHAPSSTARKTSGSSCVRTGCRTASSNLFNDIVDHCCYAWNTLIDQSWKIMSIAHRIRPLSVTLCED